MRRIVLLAGLALTLAGCRRGSGTEPPPGGWANSAPTRVERVVNREDTQLLEVRQGRLTTWVKIPPVGAKKGDYILLGQGEARDGVMIPEIETRVSQLVDIAHARVADLETAKRAVVSKAPPDAVAIGTVYAELDTRADAPIVVYGAAAKVSGAVGWYWVHLRDGTGDPEAGTHDLTVQTKQAVAEGQRVGFRGTLKADVDLGFGYHYDALVEEAEIVSVDAPPSAAER